MSKDFREVMVESQRIGDEERWFEDIIVGNLYFSVQASPAHECSPREMLDPMEYEAFQVHLQCVKGMICQPVYGPWEVFKDKPWASYFKPNGGLVQDGFNVPKDVVQRIYEDILEYAEEN